MRYLLDTNAIIALLKGESSFIQRLTIQPVQAYGVSAIVAHELYYGVFRSARVAENLERLEGLRFPVIEFDAEDARQAGAVRAALARAGEPIGPYDVLIAGQALARGLTLITRNVREFARVPELKFEDWQA